jgi:signal peptidase I
MRAFFNFIFETLKIVIISLLIVLPIRYFLFQPFLVVGQSMAPTFSTGDYLIVDQISYRLREPQRGEVIVFKYPQNPSQRYIKRIIALPGETVEIKKDKLHIFDKEGKEIKDGFIDLSSFSFAPGEGKWVLRDNEYFVLGDNRPFSFDSRRWGPLPKENIIGRVVLRIWPFSAFAYFETPPPQLWLEK